MVRSARTPFSESFSLLEGQNARSNASDDTRLHVATSTVERLTDYVFGTPSDALRSVDCVKQRCALISKNLAFLKRMEGE